MEERILLKCRCISPKARDVLLEALAERKKKGDVDTEVEELMDTIIHYADNCDYGEE